MATTIANPKEAIAEQLGSALDTLEEQVRNARRAVVRGRNAAEDLGDRGIKQLRRHPVRSVAIVAGAGALAGCMFGFVLGRRGRRETPCD